MKKVLVVLLCLTLVFAMVACSAQPAAESSAATSESAAQESKMCIRDRRNILQIGAVFEPQADA